MGSDVKNPADDPPSPERSALMARVRGRDTKPELTVRKAVHALGFRFRLHRRDLPGSPDLVLPRHKKIIFVHGCFWHRHHDCRKSSFPKTRQNFWRSKFEANVSRDETNEAALRAEGWGVLVIWECETSSHGRLAELLSRFLLRATRERSAP